MRSFDQNGVGVFNDAFVVRAEVISKNIILTDLDKAIGSWGVTRDDYIDVIVLFIFVSAFPFREARRD